MLGFFVYMFGIITCLLQPKHMLSVFVGLEMMALAVFLVAAKFLSGNVVCLMLVIRVGVCEAALRLSLLVMMARVCGNDRCSNLMGDKS